jgi:head-tail adaptor
MTVAIGQLDQRIRFERVLSGRDDMGGVTEGGWFPLGPKVWAKRTDMSDGERFAADEKSAARMTRFVARSSRMTRDVTATDRIIHKCVIYEITGAKETADGRFNFIEFTTVVRNDRQDGDI